MTRCEILPSCPELSPAVRPVTPLRLIRARPSDLLRRVCAIVGEPVVVPTSGFDTVHFAIPVPDWTAAQARIKSLVPKLIAAGCKTVTHFVMLRADGHLVDLTLTA